MERKTFKEVLEDAGRLEDVKEMINEINDKLIDQYDYPVKEFLYKDGSKKSYVNGKTVKKEMNDFLSAIEDNQNKMKYFPGCFYQYIVDYHDTLLHNYTLSLTHRNTPAESLEMIRVLLCISFLLEIYSRDDIDFYIPDGWQKHLTNYKILPI